MVASALKLAPLVFTRPGELRHAEWAEIDLDAATWCIPAHKMKMRASHIVPLSTQAVAILRDCTHSLDAACTIPQPAHVGAPHVRKRRHGCPASLGVRGKHHDRARLPQHR
ncbi:phage integrase, partial [mine drainage metagenome]